MSAPTGQDLDLRQIEQFLYSEARYADEHDYDAWEALWTDDALYWMSLAKAITAPGSQVWTEAKVRSLTLADGLVTGDHHLPADYTEAVKRADRPCAMISVNFASREPLIQAPGLLSFASARRLCYAANFTATCPEMAPDGWHLYVGTAVPRPSIGDFDEAAETELLMADLHDEFPGFDRAPRRPSWSLTR